MHPWRRHGTRVAHRLTVTATAVVTGVHGDRRRDRAPTTAAAAAGDVSS